MNFEKYVLLTMVCYGFVSFLSVRPFLTGREKLLNYFCDWYTLVVSTRSHSAPHLPPMKTTWNWDFLPFAMHIGSVIESK
jgi:hypothetical protein